MVGSAFVLPNPDEFYPTVDEFMGRPAPAGKLAQARGRIAASLRSASREAVAAPAMYVGNFPVMRNDRNALSWGNACGVPDN
jgi:hypothetical protein